MITEWLVAVGTSIGGWFATLMPDWAPPPWLANIGDTLNSVFADIDGLSPWADWVLIFAVVGLVLLTWALTFGIKIVAWLASHIPFFGGAG